MAHRALTVELIRDGQCTAWGFRMSGGADIGTPLVIQRVNMGSPAESELLRGDVILGIGEHDARKLSHQKASEIISKTGNSLKLVIARSSGPAPPMSPITSPTPGMQLTMYHLTSTPTAPTIAPYMPGHGNPDLLKPLPKTDFHTEVHKTTTSYYPLHNDAATDEKTVIATQAYRTLPLITPTLKTSKDYPMGSYLRYESDTSGRSKSKNASNRMADAYMLTKVQEAVLERALSSPRASVSSSRTPTPDSGYQSVYLRQYNSPINLYSNQAIVETLNAQTSAQKHQLNSPRVQTPCTMDPPDICKSPTYQLIQEEEWKELNKQKLREHDAVENRVYNIEEPPHPEFAAYDDIQQSTSFKCLVSNLKKGVTNI